MKKIIVFGLVLVMIFTTLAGCGSGKTTETSDSQTTGGSNASTSDKSEPVKITLMTVESDTQWNLKDTPNFKKIQEIFLEKFNVQYELETALSKEYETTITTRFASGEQLPDIINHRFASDKLLDLYENGLIIKLNDLVDNYAPEVKKIFAIRPYLVVANGDREGNILRIPAQYIENPQHRISVFHIRNDWLEKVGMSREQLKTPDDLYRALKAFQEKDVNENGRPDEILTGFGNNTFNLVIGSAFGIKYMVGAADSWYFDSNDKVYNTFLTPETKEYVTYMNKLYTEKILDEEYINQTSEQYNEKLYNNRVSSRVGAWWDSVLSSIAVKDKGFDVEYIPLMPFVSSNNNPFVYLKDLPGYGGYMITKDCKHPELAMKTIDWGYSVEGTIQNYYGESSLEGGDYYRKATPLEGLTLPEYQMEYTEKGQAAQNEEPLLWAKMGWNLEFTTKVLLGNADAVAQEFYQAFGVDKCGLGADVQYNLKGLKDAEFTYGIPAINFVSPTSEQARKWEDFSDLWIYMDEQISKFITGVEPISNWDSFVAQCEKMGIKEATEIRQEQYDAYKKIMDNLK
jgi:putative aldouronate transport system substrate-binding protein